jgi:thioredoxin 1
MMSRFEKVDDGSIEAALREADGLVAVDFTAAWCGPCRVLSPILERLSGEYEGRLRVLELDTDENPEAVVRHGVRGMPTIVFFRDGVEVNRSIGAVPEKVLRDRIESSLAAQVG